MVIWRDCDRRAGCRDRGETSSSFFKLTIKWNQSRNHQLRSNQSLFGFNIGWHHRDSPRSSVTYETRPFITRRSDRIRAGRTDLTNSPFNRRKITVKMCSASNGNEEEAGKSLGSSAHINKSKTNQFRRGRGKSNPVQKNILLSISM